MSHTGNGNFVPEPTVGKQLLKRLGELRLRQISRDRDHHGSFGGYKKSTCAGVPTGVYSPVNVNAPVCLFTRKQATASARWLHEYK